jgi:hypothetical protein
MFRTVAENLSVALTTSSVVIRLPAMVLHLEISGKYAYIKGMDFFALIFAILMIAAAIAATVILGIYAGGIWGAGAFALLLFVLYRACTHQSGPDRTNDRDTLNAFQQSLADD